MGIDFRHDQGNFGVHAEGAAIVDDYRAGGSRRRGELQAAGGAGREKGHLNALKGIFGEAFDLHRFAIKI